MENVPDMALDREMFILRTMVDELEELGLRGRGAGRRRLALRRAAVPAAADPGRARGRGSSSRGRRSRRDRSRSTTRSATCRRSRAAGGPTGRRRRAGPTTAGRRTDFQRDDARRCRDRATRRPGLRPHHPAGPRGRRARRSSIMDSETRYSDLARRAEALPRRHLRRQVQAARRRRPVAARSPPTSPRTATGTSTRSRTAR